MENRFDIETTTEFGNRFNIEPTVDQFIDKVVSRPKVELSPEGKAAEEFLKKPWWQQIFTLQFAREIPGAVETMAKEMAKQVVKPLVSVVLLPKVFITKRAEEKPIELPVIGKVSSYFYEAQRRAERIVAGDQPLWHVLYPFIEVPLDVTFLASLPKTGISLTKGTLNTLKKLHFGEMPATKELEAAGKEVAQIIKVPVKAIPTPEVEIPIKVRPLPEIPKEIRQTVIDLKTQRNIISNAAKIVEANPTDKIAIDQSKRLFKRVAEKLATGEIIPEDIPPILKKYNITPEQFAQQYINTISLAGKELNQLSQLSKKIKAVLPDTPEMQEIWATFKEAEPATFGTWNWARNLWLRVENIRRASMVAQMATSARNAISQAGRYGLDLIEEGMAGGLEFLTGKRPFKEAMSPFFEGISAIFRRLTPAGRARLAEVLEEFPLESARLTRTAMGDVALGEKYARIVNTFNSAQEFFFRKMALDAKITSEATRLGITDLKMLPEESISRAVDKALELTFAEYPEKGLFREIMRTYQRLPFLYSLGNPFPRFWANSIKFLWDFNPTGFTRLLSPSFRKLLLSENPRIAYKALSRAVLGTLMLGGAVAIRNSKFAGEKWYELKIGNKTIDLRPFAPFTTYLFIAEAMRNPKALTGFDWLDAAVSINRIAGTGLVIVDIVRSKKPETTVKLLQNFIGSWTSGFTIPFRTLSDFIGQFSEEERIVRKTDEKIYGPIIEPIPYLKRILPPYQPITRGEPVEREIPALRQITGITIRTKTFFEKELDRLGIERYRIEPRTGIEELDRLIAVEMGKIAEEKGKQLEESSYYQSLPDDIKQDVILNFFAELRRAGKERVLRKRPDLLQQLREKRGTIQFQPINRFNL